MGRASDAFDRYATEELRILWQEGITSVNLPARSGPGFGGFNAVLRLRPEDEKMLLKPEAALAATLGVGWSETQGPLTRVKLAGELRRRFQQAREYRDAWNDYQDAVKEYEEKLAERAKKSVETKPAGKSADPKPSEPPKGDKKEPPKDEKKDELKKPEEPAKDRAAETLLRVIDGDLRLWVEAHEPADILNALEAADEQNLAVVITGATGAWLVADELARRHVPVVLTAPPEPLNRAALDGVAFGADGDYARADAAAILARAGVDVYFGSGVLSGPDAAPHLALRVARAVRSGLDETAALEALTSRAARLLGIPKEAGRLGPGMPADLVIWSDHPLAAGARAERVFIGGQEVWVADGQAAEDED